MPEITIRPVGDSWDAFPEKASGGWDAFPEKSSAMDTAKDVAKSAGIGVVRGVIGLGGLVGDVTDLGAKGIKKASDFISDQTGMPRYESGDSVLSNIPTSASLTKNVESVTGDFYKPQTTAGHYAETIGEFAPAALAGPGGIARKAAMQAVLPGVASEAAGQATAGSDLEPYARAAAGIAGGLGGALVSRPASAVEAIRKQLPNLPQSAIDDARSLMQTAKAKGIDLTWPEALSQVSGKPVLSDTQRILESAQGSRTRMQDFYSQRPQQFDQAALNEFGNVAPGTRNPSQIGPQVGEAAQSHIGDVRGAINKASEPHYKQAEGILLTPSEMSHVKAIPGWTEARDAVRDNPQINWRVTHLPDNSVGFLNEVKKHFDQAAENSASKFNPGRNKQVQSSNEMAASALRDINLAKSEEHASEKIASAATKFDGKIYEGQTHADAYQKYKDETKKTDAGAAAAYEGDGFLTNSGRFVDREEAQRIVDRVSPDIDPANRRTMAQRQLYAEQLPEMTQNYGPDNYRIALEIQRQGRERFLDPLLQGPLGRLAKKDVTTRKAIDALFPSDPLPNSHNEIGDAVSALAAKNPGAATQLVRAHMESVFNEASKNLQGGPNQFGAAKFANRLVGNIQQRANLQAAVEALPNGKQIWQGIDNFLEAAEATGTRQAKGSLTAFNAQELGAMSGGGLIGETVKTGLSPGKWWSIVSDKYGQWKLGSNLDELARIFTDPKSAPLLKRISSMPTGSREAGYLVSRLILQAENAIVQPREPRRQ